VGLTHDALESEWDNASARKHGFFEREFQLLSGCKGGFGGASSCMQQASKRKTALERLAVDRRSRVSPRTDAQRIAYR